MMDKRKSRLVVYLSTILAAIAALAAYGVFEAARTWNDSH